MPPESADQTNRAAEVTSAIVVSSPWSVRGVRALPGFRLAVDFADGTNGVVDASGLILSPNAGVFSRLRDPILFEQVYISFGAVTWPGNLDLAPDAMYDEIKAHGEWKIP
jgi:hypothetical protein